MRDLARRLLEASRSPSSGSRRDGESHAREAIEVCERLRIALSRFAGPDGFAALLRRAVVLARSEVPALGTIRLDAGCHLEGLEECVEGEGGTEAAIVLSAHVLELLVTFIGEALTLRLVREAWPDIDSRQGGTRPEPRDPK